MVTKIKCGVEVHIQLDTKSKLFCSCPTNGKEEANTRTCEICLGHPGSKPVLNKQAVLLALKLAQALECKINKEIYFSRKSYFYPDLTKNFQITQYEIPLGEKGFLELPSKNKIRINRIHVEEDPGALIHPLGLQKSKFILIDYNRSGIPLVELVTEPDITSADEAREFMKQLRIILEYLEIFNINGTIKADVNISTKENNFTRVEIKNITGFKEIERAINYEIERQLQEGQKQQETRGWDADKGVTYLMRVKETEADYGYIFEPDLVMIETTELNKEVTIPELPLEKLNRFVQKYKLDREDAKAIVSDINLAKLFEEISKRVNPIFTAKFLRRDLVKYLENKSLKEVILDTQHMTELAELFCNKKITDKIAKELLEKLLKNDFSPKDYVKEKKLEIVDNVSELNKFVQQVIEENPNALEDYLKGRAESLNFLVGQVMRLSQGKASPEKVKDIFKKAIFKKDL